MEQYLVYKLEWDSYLKEKTLEVFYMGYSYKQAKLAEKENKHKGGISWYTQRSNTVFVKD